ncbi:unnamed protein product [Larinioides sclopetarius]|uniref:Uncharacterized protein n=1 Tax=Larinioides sclopetarius TaxID=280406 RepID=A0AAV1Z699_9ARAC
MPDDQLKTNHDQVAPEETSEFKFMNGHYKVPKGDESLDENHEDIHLIEMDNGFNLAKKIKELMQMKKEADALHEKWEQTEKEKSELQFQVNLLQAENHQFKHLKNQKDENSQKVNELQKDLANKLKAQLKLRNEIESCNLQISEKNDAIKKMKKDNKSLWNMVTRFARKLADADLLTPKEKNTVKKYGEENHILVDTFDSEDQGEEKDHSPLVPKSQVPADVREKTYSIENEIRIVKSDNCLPTHAKESESKIPDVKNDGFQFSHSNTSLPKPKLSTGANYFMKSCRDVIEDPHVSDDCLDITVNELKEMRRQLSASKDHFSPISPLPPTPPPSSNKFRHGLSRKHLSVNNPVLTVPVHKSPSQTSKVSKNQGLLSVNSSVPNSSRKLTFCHQQSEGFDAPAEQHTVRRFNTDTGHSDHHDKNIGSHSSSSLVPYRFSAKRCHDGTVKLNFHINNPISMTVNPNNWEVSCILGQHEEDTSDTPFTLHPPEETANVQTCESFSNNLASSEKSEHVVSNKSKVETAPPLASTTPVLKGSEQSSFVSVGKPNILSQDNSVNTNSFDCLSKETTLQKELPLNHAHISINGSKALNAFANLHRNNECHQRFENHLDDNRSVVSSSCESPSPYRKKNKLFSKEFSSPSHNLTSSVSEVKSGKLDNFSNLSKMHSLSVPEVNCQTEYDSTDSESELTDKSKLTKLNSAKSGPIKKRRKSNLMASVESSNIIPARNKGRTLLSRAFGSTKSSINTNVDLEVKNVENNESEKSTIVKLDEKYLYEGHNQKEEIKFNSSSGNNDPSNCMNSNNENTGEQVETSYKNVKDKKRVSRIKDKMPKITSVKQKRESTVDKSPKKKVKGKVELKRMAALKSGAAEWVAQKMKSNIDEKEYMAEEPFDSNFSASNTVSDSLEKNDAKKSISVFLSKTETRHEGISDIPEVKSEKLNHFSNDSVNSSDGYCANIQNKDVSVTMINDALLNAPSTNHVTNKKNQENPKIDTEESNIFILDSTPCSISKNDQFGETFHALEKVNNQNNNEPAPASDHCYISVSSDFPSNHKTEQRTNNSISDPENLIKNVKCAEIKNIELFKPNSFLESLDLSKYEASKSPKQENKNSYEMTNSVSSPLLKSPPLKIKSPKSSPIKIKSPKSSPIKIKSPKSSLKAKSPKSAVTKIKYSEDSTTLANSSDFNSFSNMNNSEVKAEFPEVSLPPLPLDPFGLSGDKSNTFSQVKTFVDGKFIESPVSPSLERNAKLSFSNNKELDKLTLLSENRNNTEGVNNAKTNLTTLFNQEEFTNESFIDFLVKDELDDTDMKTISDTGTTETSNTGDVIDNAFSKTEVKELLTSSIPGDIVSSAASSSEPVSKISSNVNIISENEAIGDINKVKESKATSRAVSCDKEPPESNSQELMSNFSSNIDMIIESVVVGGIEIEVETHDPPPRPCRKRQGPVVGSSHHAEKRKVKGGLKSIDLSIAKESVLSDSDTKHIGPQISEADSVIGGVEIEVKTQDPPPRTCRKRQGPVVDSSHHYEKRKVKGGLKSIDLSIAKESALSDGDAKYINGQISEADSDIESPLVIAEDIEEVQQSIPISKTENSEENVVNLLDKISPTKTLNKKQKNVIKTSKKIENKVELSQIDAAFHSLDKIRFSETNFKHQVHTLVNTLINPSIFESTPKLVFYLVKYLHATRKNPMLSFSLSTDPDTLLPISEQCIVKALLVVDAKNKPHLSGLLTYVVETLYQLVLGKVQYHIYGLSSLCRVLTVICKELNDLSKPRHLCCDVLKYNHKFAPFLIASVVGVYREAFEVLPDTTEEEKIFLSALSYGVQQKPKTLTETQWKHCNNVFSKYLTVEFLTNVSETIPYLMSAIEDKCMSAPYENEYLLMGPLVIYARVKGWSWALEYLLEDYVLPNLEAYSNKENGERAFAFFTNLCADICYGCPNEELSRSCLMKYWKSSGEREFVPIHAGAALLKLILLRKELFPDEMQEWISYYHEDPRVVEYSNVYFKLRLMEDQELALKDNIIY